MSVSVIGFFLPASSSKHCNRAASFSIPAHRASESVFSAATEEEDKRSRKHDVKKIMLQEIISGAVHIFKLITILSFLEEIIISDDRETQKDMFIF
jgi:hypothetical protein